MSKKYILGFVFVWIAGYGVQTYGGMFDRGESRLTGYSELQASEESRDYVSSTLMPARPRVQFIAGHSSGGDCDWASCDQPLSCDGASDNQCCRSDRCRGLFGSGFMPNLSGLVKRSEGCFDDFISPMTNPVYFEDPRQLTEVRAIFLDHKIPVVLGNPSGSIQLFAAQVRVRLTENLSLIAVKDGYVVSDSPLLDDGWVDITPGLKYTMFRDTCSGRLLSIGARFEAPSGMNRTLQGNGDGVFDFFLSGCARVDSKSHWMTSSGFVLPSDSQAENQMWYWSNHLDRKVANSPFYLFTELNWYHYLKDASAFPLALEGGDLFNLGSTGIGGNEIVTNAYGLKYKPTRALEAGVAWEFPLTERRGILDNRLTADLILRY